MTLFTTENLNILKERISSIDVTIVAEIGSMGLSVRDVLSLRPGDVIRLPDVRVGDPMVVSIGNQKKFLCRPGVVGNKLAVQVIKKIEETKPEDFEELAAGGEESV